jgi:NAD(P)H-flavin reductase/ferredoxin
VSISAETRKLLLDGRIYDCRPGETVLDALLRQNVAVPNACRSQVCLTCMMRSLGGAPPSASQTNLKDNLRTQHFFLACGCHPERDIEIAICGCYSEPDMEIAIAWETAAIKARFQVAEINRLNPFVAEVVLQCEPPLHYRGGQFMTLFNDKNMGNRFPISSPTSGSLAGKVDIQVQRIPGGVFSEWVHTNLRVGVEDKEHLYFVEELREVADRFERFHYVPCVRTGALVEGCASGTIQTNVERLLPDLSGVKVYLCGPRNEVHALQRHAYLAGAAMKDIRTDVTNT